MTIEATRRGDGKTFKFTLAAAQNGGDIIQAAGTVGVVAGSAAHAIGDEVTVEREGEYDVASASGTTFAIGVTVGWDDTAKLAVAGGAGDFDIGEAVKAKVAGETVVRGHLNAQ